MLYLLYITVWLNFSGHGCASTGNVERCCIYSIPQYGCISLGMGVPVLGIWRYVQYLLYITVWLYFSGHGCASAGNVERCCNYCISQYGCISLDMGVLVLGMWRNVVFTVYHSMAEFLWAWVC